MKTTTDRRPSTAGRRGPRGYEETLAQQLCAAVGYAIVAIMILIGTLGTFTDDFGLGQAGIAVVPIALVSFWSIRRRNR